MWDNTYVCMIKSCKIHSTCTILFITLYYNVKLKFIHSKILFLLKYTRSIDYNLDLLYHSQIHFLNQIVGNNFKWKWHNLLVHCLSFAQHIKGTRNLHLSCKYMDHVCAMWLPVQHFHTSQVSCMYECIHGISHLAF